MHDLKPSLVKLGGQSRGPGRRLRPTSVPGDKTELDRIGYGRENDRYVFGGIVRRQSRNVAAGRNNHRDAKLDQLRGERRQPAIIIVRPAILDLDVLVFRCIRLRRGRDRMR